MLQEWDRMNTTWLVPKKYEALLKADFAATAPGWPDWIRSMRFNVKDHDDNDDGGKTIADCVISYEYRSVGITFYQRYFNEPTRARRQSLLHEAGHAVHAPLAELRSLYVNEDQDRKEGTVDVDELWRRAEEKACEDYSNCAYDMIFMPRRQRKEV